MLMQEDLDEEECPEGFKLAGSVPEARQDAKQNQDSSAAGEKHPVQCFF